MAGRLPDLEVSIDITALAKRFGKKAMGEAELRAMKLVGVRLLELVRSGFAAGGYDPQSGEAGYWPKKQIPEGGGTARTKGGKASRVRKARQGGGNTLYQTGRYFNSINLKVTKAADGAEATVGTNVEYAKYHEQPGNTRGYTEQKATAKQAAFLRALGYTVRVGSIIRLPQRRVFVMPGPWRAELMNLFRDELVQGLAAQRAGMTGGRAAAKRKAG